MFEVAGKKILVDPGNLKFEESFINEWKTADAILISHRHADHCKADTIKEFNIPIYSTQEVANYYPDLKINIVKAGDTFYIGKAKIEVVRAIHGFHPVLMKERKGEIFENIGFILDDGKTRAYFTSDTICFNHDYKADIIFAPVTGNCVTMDAIAAAMFTKDVSAKKLYIVHLDSYELDMEQVQKTLTIQGIDFEIMQNGKEYAL